MALEERAVRRPHLPWLPLEQSGKAEQKTQDDGAENVCAWVRMELTFSPRSNLARLPGGSEAALRELAACGLRAELMQRFAWRYLFSEELQAGPCTAAHSSLELSCPCPRQELCSCLSWGNFTPDISAPGAP